VNPSTTAIFKEEIMFFDPVTREWVFPNGIRLPMIMGASTMVSDEVEGRGGGRDTDVELEPEEEEGSEERDEDEDEDQPPSDQYVSRADHERIKTALRNERREKKRLKTDYENRIQKLTSESTESSEIEVEKAKIAVKNERDNYWMEQIVRARAATEFAAQGASSSNADRLANMVDLKKVEYDEREKEFEGLEEEIEDIIGENPEFFKKKGSDEETTSSHTQRVPRPRVEGASRGRQGGGTSRKQSSAEKLAARALGRSPRRQ
jgi:hypothetical protein